MFSRAKAVADGAVIWSIKQSVKARVPRYAFGVGVAREFDPEEPEHSGRRVFDTESGLHVMGVWSSIVNNVCIVCVLPRMTLSLKMIG